MNTERVVRFPKDATTELHSAGPPCPTKDAGLTTTQNVRETTGGRSLNPNPGREWQWPQALRLAILLSGLFWLVAAICVWAYFNVGWFK